MEDAIELGRRSIYHATFRDAVSGGTVSGAPTTHAVLAQVLFVPNLKNYTVQQLVSHVQCTLFGATALLGILIGKALGVLLNKSYQLPHPLTMYCTISLSSSLASPGTAAAPRISKNFQTSCTCVCSMYLSVQ